MIKALANSKFGQALMAGAAATMTIAPAFAQTAPANQNVEAAMQEVSITNVSMSLDADRAAYQWAQNNPRGVAVPVHLGRDTTVPVQNIETILRRDFAEYGIQQVEFFYEDAGIGGSALAYVTRNQIYGPFALQDARSYVAQTANQQNFEIQQSLN